MANRKPYVFKPGKETPCQVVFPTPKSGVKQGGGGRWYMWKFEINQIEERCFLSRDASDTLEDMDLHKGDWVSIEVMGDDEYSIDFCEEPEWQGAEEEDEEEEPERRSRSRKRPENQSKGKRESKPAQAPQRPTVADALAGMCYIVDSLRARYEGNIEQERPEILSGEDLRSLAQTVYKSVERELTGFAALGEDEPEEEPEDELEKRRKPQRRTSRREPPPEEMDDDDLPF